MADYHTVYKGPEGETTQWHDIQVKLGNYAPKPKPEKPAPFEPAKEQEKDAAYLDGLDEEELEDLEDEFMDNRFMEQYRQRRILELQSAAAVRRFGSLTEIRRQDFLAEVTNAGEDVWVVLLLYKDSVEACGMLEQCFRELAAKYPTTKFLKILATDCIPGYPDRNLPTVLLYHDTKCLQHIVGLAPWGGKAVTPEGISFALTAYGKFCDNGDGDETAARRFKEFVDKMVEKREEQPDEDSDFGD